MKEDVKDEGRKAGAGPTQADLPLDLDLLPPEGELIARVLIRLRGERSRAEVAKAAGLDEATWEHYESGRRSFTQKQRLPLAKGLGVSFYELEHTLWRERAAALRELEGRWPGEFATEPSEAELTDYLMGLAGETLVSSVDLIDAPPPREILWLRLLSLLPYEHPDGLQADFDEDAWRRYFGEVVREAYRDRSDEGSA